MIFKDIVSNLENWVPSETQWILYDPKTIYISLIYSERSKWLHVDIERGLTSGNKDFPAKQTHEIISAIFEAKKITIKRQ